MPFEISLIIELGFLNSCCYKKYTTLSYSHFRKMFDISLYSVGSRCRDLLQSAWFTSMYTKISVMTFCSDRALPPPLFISVMGR
ncbi:hypothetical protein GDO81_000957 [Engystomops pustulosus]|uniref:Uncharacterized protein n=1 Tax=Engystomops pustulosus TaxID=76066 RepID=A0AAV7DC67_ENGPU|nr:hypothetical protein GDO81_000957 [Engystomops pustulosus]